MFPALPCAHVVKTWPSQLPRQKLSPGVREGQGVLPLQLSELTAGSGGTSSGKRKGVEIISQRRW